MTMTTDETAARLGELLAKVTSLPWRLGRRHNGLSVSALSDKKMQIATSSWHSSSEHYPTQQATLDNFALIIAAVNALPALLDELAALRASQPCGGCEHQDKPGPCSICGDMG